MTELLRAFFRFTLLPPIRLRYRLQVLNAERIPEYGGILLISNHVSYLDSFILYAACPRPVRFVIVSRFMRVKAISWFLNLFGAIAITPGKSRDAIRITSECLKAGDVVCIFPEGQLTRTGHLNELKKGFELIARKADCPVMPVWMQGLWGSFFSFERGRYFHKWPHRHPPPVTVVFGEMVEPSEARVAWARETLCKLSAEALGADRGLDGSLSAAIVRGLRRNPGAPCFVEHLKDGKPPRRLKRHHVLSTAVALAGRWSHALPEEESRIGVLLPAGSTPALINLGLILAGKVPVNLPFPDNADGVLDPEKVTADIRISGVRTVITSRAFFGILGDVDWPESEEGESAGRFLDMAAEMSGAGLLARLRERILSLVEPTSLAIRRLDLPREPGNEPAWAYVSDGEIHEFDETTLLAQALRLTTGNWLETGESIFCEYPLTGIDGALWSLWLPSLHGFSVAGRSWAARDDSTLIETICRSENVRRLVFSDNTARELAELDEPWHPELRESVRSLLIPVSAVDPGDPKQFSAVETITGGPVCPYWAPDSAESGLLAISQPDPNPGQLKHIHQPQHGRREKSLGRLLPGIAVSEGDSLRFSGPGIGNGEEWVEVREEVRIDEEGFIYPCEKETD